MTGQTTPPTRVLIVDDDPVVRFGLGMMLRGAPDLVVVGEAGDGAEALRLVAEHAPDVVLMDIRMPGMDGLAATEQLLARPTPPRIIVLTTFDADESVLRALRAGAAGFLLKDTPPDELVEAVRGAAAGRPALSADVTRRLVELADAARDDPRRAAARRRLDTLAPREMEVAIEIAAGRSNADIASRHHLSVPTVKTHVSSILTKLGLTNRVQIALIVHDAALDRNV
ncbi:response regulator transcription factor [Nonomuraea sp. NPDC046802]|uniref:response regulator transcription factor n=1 Tax=Nonomuraea sp. NPDC046802 TaxID=3154919 RepID=UPI0033FAA8E1